MLLECNLLREVNQLTFSIILHIIGYEISCGVSKVALNLIKLNIGLTLESTSFSFTSELLAKHYSVRPENPSSFHTLALDCVFGTFQVSIFFKNNKFGRWTENVTKLFFESLFAIYFCRIWTFIEEERIESGIWECFETYHMGYIISYIFNTPFQGFLDKVFKKWFPWPFQRP